MSKPAGSPKENPTATDSFVPAYNPTAASKREHAVPSVMILRGADELDRGAVKAWLSETRAWIRDGIRDVAGRRRPLTVRFDGQEAFDADGHLRRLRSPSIKIRFTTTLVLDPGDGERTPSELVAAGLLTPSQREAYLDALKAGGGDPFENVQDMALEVDGTWVSPRLDEASIPEAGLPAAMSPTTPRSRRGNARPLYYIVGGLAGGAIVALVAAGARRFTTRSATASSPPPSKSPRQETPTAVDGTVASGSARPPPGARPPRPPSTTPTFPDTATPVRTIESREGEDDVSTLECPYFPPQFPRIAVGEPLAEDTVGESLVSSEHRGYVWEVGRERLTTGDPSTVAGTNMFVDDSNTLEGIYQTPASSREDGPGFHDGDESSDLQCLTVVAPPGWLGINFDLRTGNMPLVLTVEATSPVHGQVNVGDLVLSVDEIDCRGLSAVQVSRLIGGRRRNPARTLVLMRGSGSC